MIKFLNKDGSIRLRYIPIVIGPLLVCGMAYGAALSIGPAIGLFFLGFMVFFVFVVGAVHNDEIQQLKAENEKLRNDIEELRGALQLCKWSNQE